MRTRRLLLIAYFREDVRERTLGYPDTRWHYCCSHSEAVEVYTQWYRNGGVRAIPKPYTRFDQGYEEFDWRDNGDGTRNEA